MVLIPDGQHKCPRAVILWHEAFNNPRGGGGATTMWTTHPPSYLSKPGVGRGWHKALVVGSISLWLRLLASRP